MRCDSRRRRRSGATLVETIFVILIFLMLLFGIFEYGRFVMTKQIMENAAREGARWAAVHTFSGTTANVQDVVDQKLSSARSQLVGYNKTTSITVFAADDTGNPISGALWSDQDFAQGIGVQITGTFKPILPNLLKMNTSFTITAKSVMQSEAN